MQEKGEQPVTQPVAASAKAPPKAAAKAGMKIDSDVPMPSDEPVVRKTVDVVPSNPAMDKIMAEWNTDD
jgi:hypothetical protein